MPVTGHPTVHKAECRRTSLPAGRHQCGIGRAGCSRRACAPGRWL